MIILVILVNQIIIKIYIITNIKQKKIIMNIK